MLQYLIMCRSLTYAQRATRTLERAGIFSAVAKAPQNVSTEGCTYGVKVQEKYYNKAIKIIRDSKISVGKIYSYDDDGGVCEVSL